MRRGYKLGRRGKSGWSRFLGGYMAFWLLVSPAIGQAPPLPPGMPAPVVPPEVVQAPGAMPPGVMQPPENPGGVGRPAGALRPGGVGRPGGLGRPGAVAEAGAGAEQPGAERRGGGSSAKDKKGVKYEDAPLKLVLEEYGERTGRTLLLAPEVNLGATKVTLRNQTELSNAECLEAIEAVLAMHKIGLIKSGEKFLKVVPINQARQEAMDLKMRDPRLLAGDTNAVAGAGEQASNELISQLIELKYITMEEARKAVEPIKHAYAQIHSFDNRNSLLITDTAENVKRMVEVIEYIDRKVDAREQQFVVQIRHSKASEIKAKLMEIVESQKKATGESDSTVPRQKRTGAPGAEVAPAPAAAPAIPGVIRPRVAAPAAAPGAVEELPPELSDAVERGLIRGNVLVIADDRTNLLIIITTPENMSVFEKLIAVLDVATAPDVVVKVFRLEFAEAKTVAGMLNELIGAKAPTMPAVPTAPGAPTTPGAPGVPTAPGTPGVPAVQPVEQRSSALNEYVARREAAILGGSTKSKIGELSKENIKILSDDRTNSLIIMASKGDLAMLQEIIRDMDMMLSQVLLESVILDVTLSDGLSSGVDWVQRSMIAFDKTGTGQRNAFMGFRGAGGGGELGVPAEGFPIPKGGGLSYYMTFFNLNIDAVVQMTASDSRAKIISTPVILTTDNKAATISSTQQIYINKGIQNNNTVNGGTFVNWDIKDVGLELSVTPHINENKVVMMEIKQTMSQPGKGTPTEGGEVSSTRSMQASIAVKNSQTVILGGLVRADKSSSRTKIPFLGDIPLLGRLFSFVKDSQARTETVVFITPYVLDSSEDIEQATTRRKGALNLDGLWKRGWSDSRMAEEAEGVKGKRDPILAPRGGARDVEPAGAGTNEAPDMGYFRPVEEPVVVAPTEAEAGGAGEVGLPATTNP